MKQFLASKLSDIKQFSLSLLSNAKQFFAPKFSAAKQYLSSWFCKVTQQLPPGLCKALVLIVVIVLVLIIGLTRCSREEVPPLEEPAATASIDNIMDDSTTVESEEAIATYSMGTITADKLHVRKGPDSKYETNGAYYKGDRIEILEMQTVDDTTWARTNLGWVGMGYVRMDGEADSNANPNLISNGNTDVLGYGVVDLKELNVRLGPDTDYEIVGTIKHGIRYAYYQVSSSYENWVRIEDGWVSLDYFYLEGTVADDAITGTVNTADLNIRSGPNTSFQSIGTYNLGDTIEVLAQVGAWGYTEKGWVFMNYVEPNKPVYSTGPVTVISGLNIRQLPSADSDIVGTYTTGDRITIVEVIDNWGQTDLGWINLKYVAYD